MGNFIDGRAGLSEIVALNITNGNKYYCSDWKLSSGVDAKALFDTYGRHVGSISTDKEITGSCSFTYQSLDHAAQTSSFCVKRKHVFQRGGLFYVIGAMSEDSAVGEQIKISAPFMQLVNPVISNGLSDEGNAITVAKTAGSAFTRTWTAVNTRAGSTLAWSIVASKDTHVIPAGMAVVAVTGVMSQATPAAGTWVFDVLCTETLAGKPTCVGYTECTYVVT